MPYCSAEEMKKVLDEYPQYRDKLYCRGFLLTNGEDADLSEYPFYGNWSKQELCGGCSLYLHRDAAAYAYTEGAAQYFLIGHAYDPFNMKWDENELLKDIAAAKENGDEAFWDAVSNFTGVFCIGYIENGKVIYATDCCGMQLVNHGVIDGKLYITSHAKLVADLRGLEQDEYVTEIVASKYWRFFGTWLPGDLSPYKELKRAVPNFGFCFEADEAKISKERFYPCEKISEVTTTEEYSAVVEELAREMSCTMECIANKWQDRKVSIAVTGGRDSLTALSCTNGLYDRFSYFSYTSNQDESVDADAAKIILDNLGLKQELFVIPKTVCDEAETAAFGKILECNAGCIGKNNENDVRKRLYFLKNSPCDMEVKSWVNEMGRGWYQNKFNKNNFPRYPYPSYCRAMHKVFVSPTLIHKTNAVFRDYLDSYYGKDVFDRLSWLELYFWEFAWSGGEGVFLTAEQRTTNDITVPFNNRKYVGLMMRVPIEKRKNDDIPNDIIAYKEPRIAETGISVKDISHTDRRANLERIHLELSSKLIF